MMMPVETLVQDSLLVFDMEDSLICWNWRQWTVCRQFVFGTASAKKERGDLFGIDVAFSVKQAHFIVIPAERMDTAGIVGGDDQ